MVGDGPTQGDEMAGALLAHSMVQRRQRTTLIAASKISTPQSNKWRSTVAYKTIVSAVRDVGVSSAAPAMPSTQQCARIGDDILRAAGARATLTLKLTRRGG